MEPLLKAMIETTLRENIATNIFSSLIGQLFHDPQVCAQKSVSYADTLLAELDKGPQ